MLELTKCERCGTELMLWMDTWFERIGRVSTDNSDVWMDHTPESCSEARAAAQRRIAESALTRWEDMKERARADMGSGAVHDQDDQPSRARVEGHDT